jgi:hypothetical protein
VPSWRRLGWLAVYAAQVREVCALAVPITSNDPAIGSNTLRKSHLLPGLFFDVRPLRSVIALTRLGTQNRQGRKSRPPSRRLDPLKASPQARLRAPQTALFRGVPRAEGPLQQTTRCRVLVFLVPRMKRLYSKKPSRLVCFLKFPASVVLKRTNCKFGPPKAQTVPVGTRKTAVLSGTYRNNSAGQPRSWMALSTVLAAVASCPL